MQRLALLLCATVLALSFTACSTTTKTKGQSCCSTDGSCKAPMKKAH